MNYRIGVFLQKMARVFFSRVPGVCWNCGSNCGMNSTIARGHLWCNECFNRYSYVIRDSGFIFNWRYFGYPKSALKKG